MRLLALASVLAVTAIPVVGSAQAPTPAGAQSTLKISDSKTQNQARRTLDRAAALVAMAREAPPAASDPVSAHHVALLARQAAASYRVASAAYAEGSYRQVIAGAHESIDIAQQAIAFVLPSGSVIEQVVGGDVALVPAPAARPALVPVLNAALSAEVVPRQITARIIGPVPFGAEPTDAGPPPPQVPVPFGVVAPDAGIPQGQPQAQFPSQ